MSLKVWQVDPAHLTPYYDAALCTALAGIGCSIRHMTSPFLYDSALPSSTNYRTDYFYFRRMNHFRLLDYPYLRRGLRAMLYMQGHKQFVRELDTEPPDVVHLQWSRMPRFDGWLIKQIRRRGIPVIHTVHDIEPLFPTTSLADIYKASDCLIVHTKINRNTLIQLHPHLRADKIHVVEHIATEWQMPLRASRTLARERLGIPLDVPVILFFGSIRCYKGLDLLLKAYTQAKIVFPKLWIVIAGRPENKHLLSRLKQLGPQSVTKLEYIPSDEVWLYHLAADLAIFPYRKISQSGELITAMGFGLPVIVTNVGGMRETLDGNGWVVPSDDPTAMAQILVEVVSNLSRLQQMGQRSKQLIYERHSPETIARQTMAVYEETCAAYSLYH